MNSSTRGRNRGHMSAHAESVSATAMTCMVGTTWAGLQCCNGAEQLCTVDFMQAVTN
jgi:hypothetical protein